MCVCVGGDDRFVLGLCKEGSGMRFRWLFDMFHVSYAYNCGEILFLSSFS